jgi:hypothetical protein
MSSRASRLIIETAVVGAVVGAMAAALSAIFIAEVPVERIQLKHYKSPLTKNFRLNEYQQLQRNLLVQ